MRVKICGITHLDDAQMAAELGADAVGFVFAPESPRFITPEAAARIVARLPPFVVTVGVVTAGDKEHLQPILDTCGIHLLQFHGDFPEAILSHFRDKAIRVIRVKDRKSLDALPPTPTRGLLLDSFHAEKLGGSGTVFDWEIAAAIPPLGRVILSGGLTPENVQRACERIRPYGVDVSSGVERHPGRKDPDKMARFIRAAKGLTFEPTSKEAQTQKGVLG